MGFRGSHEGFTVVAEPDSGEGSYTIQTAQGGFASKTDRRAGNRSCRVGLRLSSIFNTNRDVTDASVSMAESKLPAASR